jgi:hypothetical protein
MKDIVSVDGCCVSLNCVVDGKDIERHCFG